MCLNQPDIPEPEPLPEPEPERQRKKVKLGSQATNSPTTARARGTSRLQIPVGNNAPTKSGLGIPQ